jgi:hypothetical protein
VKKFQEKKKNLRKLKKINPIFPFEITRMKKIKNKNADEQCFYGLTNFVIFGQRNWEHSGNVLYLII